LSQALVSVVTATYRQEDALKRALFSLGEQTYPNMEIVLVDDSAEKIWNEKVASIVEAFRTSYPNVSLQHITNPENLGSAKSRNVGIAAAKGEYITFLDDDDEYLPEKVANQVSEMVESQADYSITDLKLYNENDHLIDTRSRAYIKSNDPKQLMRYHLMYHMTGTDTMMFRKEYLLAIEGFSLIDLGDEFYLMEKAISKGGKFVYVPVCDVKAYVHTGENGLSSGLSKIQCENSIYEFKKKWFADLDRKTIRQIKMQHCAVLAFARLRRKEYGKFLKQGFKAVLVSPIGGIKLILNRKL
jgi:glycosyltransferase involved in cell wall biosynthesis